MSLPAGPRKTRRRDQQWARRAEVAKMRLEGRTMEYIAARVGCAVSTVHADCEALRQQWRARAAGSSDELMSQELEQLEAVRHQAWRAYRDSQTKFKPEGAPRFLEIARKATVDIIKLLGLDDPVAFQAKRVTGEQGTDSEVDIIELVVTSRDELADLTDAETGTISLAAFKERLIAEAQSQHVQR